MLSFQTQSKYPANGSKPGTSSSTACAGRSGLSTGPSAGANYNDRAGHYNDGAGPSNFGAGSTNLFAGPPNLGAGPSNFGAEPSHFFSGPSNIGAGPSNFGTGSSNFGAGPSNSSSRPRIIGGRAAKTTSRAQQKKRQLNGVSGYSSGRAKYQETSSDEEEWHPKRGKHSGSSATCSSSIKNEPLSIPPPGQRKRGRPQRTPDYVPLTREQKQERNKLYEKERREECKKQINLLKKLLADELPPKPTSPQVIKKTEEIISANFDVLYSYEMEKKRNAELKAKLKELQKTVGLQKVAQPEASLHDSESDVFSTTAPEVDEEFVKVEELENTEVWPEIYESNMHLTDTNREQTGDATALDWFTPPCQWDQFQVETPDLMFDPFLAAPLQFPEPSEPAEPTADLFMPSPFDFPSEGLELDIVLGPLDDFDFST